MISQVEPSGAVVRSGADSPRLLGQINDQIVLGLLLDHGPMTRSRIGELTGLSKPTISALLDRLSSRHLVEEAGAVSRGPGPKARTYRVNPSAGYVIGIHVEERGSVAALASLTGDIVASYTVDIPDRREARPRDEIRRAVDGVTAAAGLERSQVDRVVVATPGVIDPATGALRHARHLHGWEEPGLRDALEHDLGLPVSHGNDVNLAAVAEGLRGAARDRSDYALLWLDRGVGLGLVSGGRIRVGAHGGAGEIGYLPAPGLSDLPRVDQGATGAFQQLVGHQGIRELAEQHRIHGTGAADIVAQAARAGEPGDEFLTALADRIAIGAAAVAALIDPELIILGGPVAHAGGRRLVDLVSAGLGRVSFVCPPLAASTVGDDGVLTGALEVALQAVRSRLFGQPMAALLG